MAELGYDRVIHDGVTRMNETGTARFTLFIFFRTVGKVIVSLAGFVSLSLLRLSLDDPDCADFFVLIGEGGGLLRLLLLLRLFSNASSFHPLR